ncbi:MAG: hypothetical protein LBI49_07305 [Nocardiopsaceae bacterium]|jgi:hypothetical protein|nr:hypothetical protein [Nocardiopsaceae bacterium]
MDENTHLKRRWSDTELAAAVARSRSWRGVMRELGIPVTSSRAITAAKQDLARLRIGTSHFTGQRTWSDPQLKRAFAYAQSWGELLVALGLDPHSGDARGRVRGHAMRLGLDLSKVDVPGPGGNVDIRRKPDRKNLRDAGTSLAATWFLFRGYNVAYPIEPTAYDLLVAMEDGIKRVQVKTTTFCGKDGWRIQVGHRPYSPGNRTPRIPYDPTVIDLFFIVDGDLTMYLIPISVIGGRVIILLRTYTNYIVGNVAGLAGASLAS